MGTIAYLDTVMRADVQNLNTNIQRANSTLDKHARVAKRAKAANDSMSQGFSRAANSIAIMEGPLGATAGRLSSVAAGLKAIGPAGLAASVGVAATVAALTKGVSVLMETERQMLRTEALLHATGSASGFTAAQLDKQAREVALNTLASTEGIRDAQGVLLTFKSVHGDVFRQAIELSQDMAEVMGSDAKSAVTQLAKALEDPEKGVNALRRAGVSFTDAEREQIKALMEANDLMEAQSIILDKVAGQFSGAGTKAAEGLAGAIDTLGQRFDELLERFAKSSGAGNALEAFLNRLSQGMAVATEMMAPEDAADVFNRRLDLVMQLSDAEQELANMGYQDELQLKLIQSLKERIADTDTLMKAQIEGQKDIIDNEREAYEKGLEQQELMRQQAIEAKRIADEEERRVDAQKESIRLAKSRTSKSDSLYFQLFGKDEAKKSFKQNREFEVDAKSAKRLIDEGFVTGAQKFLGRAEASYRASKTLGRPYDLDGMKDIIVQLRERAGLAYKDPDRKNISGRLEKSGDSGESILEITRENGGHLKLVADNTGKMTEAVNGYLEAVKQAKEQTGNKRESIGSIELNVMGDGHSLTGTLMGDPSFLKELKAFFDQSTNQTARAVAR